MFDWDSANIGHIAQHDITRAEAEEVIHNDPLDIPPPQVRNGEQRFVHLGVTNAGRVLFVIVTERGELLRVVTAFDANPHWKRFYEKQRIIDYGDPDGTSRLSKRGR